ncbi:sulfite exporter TauE/SafE family protein [Bilophila wadsworthia]|uniref:sulfite exporter TauE/SafE family protein n=1 Tax=Bilophila wadsworthia TaxID=35833 RepID=UPI00242C420E|nr:sulfite exporter TauE/SafE family protein [Bilophila wadsworthia]
MPGSSSSPGSARCVQRSHVRFDVTAHSRIQTIFLFLLGSFVGFMAGLTGVGGPVLSVPFMIGMGFAPLYSIAIGQPLQVVAGTSDSIANILSGSIDYTMVMWVTFLELFGVYMGIIAAYRMNSQGLRKIISCLCILTSLYLFFR